MSDKKKVTTQSKEEEAGPSSPRLTSDSQQDNKSKVEAPPQNVPRLRAASDTGVPVKKDKSDVTQTSSLNWKRFSPRNSGVSTSPSNFVQQSLNQQPTVLRNFSGKHRQSGLFSGDELSLDLSRSPSQIIGEDGKRQYQFPGVSQGTAGSAEGERNHPLSLAGSSIGSTAFFEDEDMRQFYKPFRRRWRRFRRKYKGVIFALISSLTSSLASFFVKKLTKSYSEHKDPSYSPSYCLLWRYFGVLFPGIFIVLYYRLCQSEMVFDTIWPLKEKVAVKRFILSIARAVVDVVAVFLNYTAFKYLLQSETSTILNSKPIVVQLLAHYTLGEPWGVVPILMSFVAAIGVIIMSRPPFLDHADTDSRDFVKLRLPGVLYATGSMILSSVVYIILRYLKDVHYSVFSLFIGTIGLVFGIGMNLSLHEFTMPANLNDWLYFISVAILVCFSSIAIVIALQNEEAFVVSLVRSCDVIFSFIWEMCLDGNFPDGYRGGGATIIMFCVVVIFFRKYLSHQSTESRVYKRFKCLLK